MFTEKNEPWFSCSAMIVEYPHWKKWILYGKPGPQQPQPQLTSLLTTVDFTDNHNSSQFIVHGQWCYIPIFEETRGKPSFMGEIPCFGKYNPVICEIGMTWPRMILHLLDGLTQFWLVKYLWFWLAKSMLITTKFHMLVAWRSHFLRVKSSVSMESIPLPTPTCPRKQYLLG